VIYGSCALSCVRLKFLLLLPLLHQTCGCLSLMWSVVFSPTAASLRLDRVHIVVPSFVSIYAAYCHLPLPCLCSPNSQSVRITLIYLEAASVFSSVFITLVFLTLMSSYNSCKIYTSFLAHPKPRSIGSSPRLRQEGGLSVMKRPTPPPNGVSR